MYYNTFELSRGVLPNQASATGRLPQTIHHRQAGGLQGAILRITVLFFSLTLQIETRHIGNNTNFNDI